MGVTALIRWEIRQNGDSAVERNESLRFEHHLLFLSWFHSSFEERELRGFAIALLALNLWLGVVWWKRSGVALAVERCFGVFREGLEASVVFGLLLGILGFGWL